MKRRVLSIYSDHISGEFGLNKSNISLGCVGPYFYRLQLDLFELEVTGFCRNDATREVKEFTVSSEYFKVYNLIEV